MAEYVPDRWVKIRVSTSEGTYDKVFAGWYGGYLEGDSWKISSAIESEAETDESFIFKNASGSTYFCSKNCYGMSGYMCQIYAQLEKELGSTGSVEVLPGPGLI